MNRSRVTEVYDPLSQRVGTGYLITNELMLTAYHVVQGDRTLLSDGIEIRRLSGGEPTEWLAAEVVWPPTVPDLESDPLADVALLRVMAVEGPDPFDGDSPGLGSIVGDARVECTALGFPDAGKHPDDTRDTWSLHGNIDPLHEAKHPLLVVHVTGIVPKVVKTSGWRGMSGAAVFAGALLVGVLTEDHKITDRPEVLRAVPIADLIDRPGFTETLQTFGVDPAFHQVDGSRSGEPAHFTGPIGDLPTEPEEGFVGRREELARASRLAKRGTITPVVGPEHVGKSAFIRQLLTEGEFRRRLPREERCGLLELDISATGTRNPVLRSMATALNQSLFDFEELGEDAAAVNSKRQYLVEEVLGRLAHRRPLVVTFDCAPFGRSVENLERDLDSVLRCPAFQRFITLVASAGKLQVDGEEQLRRLPAVELGGLKADEASRLLSQLLAQYDIHTDAHQAFELADDEIVRRPNIIVLGADRYAARHDREAGGQADPSEVCLDLIDACRTTVASSFLESGCSLVAADGTAGALAPLLVWALSHGREIPAAVLDAMGVNQEMMAGLIQGKVLIRRVSTSSDGQNAIASFTLGDASREALRNLVLGMLSAGGGRSLKDIEIRLLGGSRTIEPDRFDQILAAGAARLFPAGFATAYDEGDNSTKLYVSAIERTVGWLEQHASGLLPILSTQLKEYANSQSVDDLFPAFPEAVADYPVTDSPAADSAQPRPQLSLYGAVADLNLAMREVRNERTKKRFVRAAGLAGDALFADTPEFDTHLVRAIDNAFFFGATRFGCPREVLAVRASLMPLLQARATEMTRGRVGRIICAASWSLNTAELQLDLCDDAAGRLSAAVACDLITQLPEPVNAQGILIGSGLRMRAARTRARYATDEEERLDALRDALRYGAEGLRVCRAHAPEKSRLWTKRFLDAAIHHAGELRLDEERAAAANEAMAVLEGVFGARAYWPIATRFAAARFLRRLHSRQADPSLRLSGAALVMELLRDEEPGARQQAEGGNPEALVELARAFDFSARMHFENEQVPAAFVDARKAEELSEYAASTCPTAVTYRTWLFLLHQRESWDATLATAGRRRRFVASHRAVEIAQKWLNGQDSMSYDHALLNLWCIETGWHRSGRTLSSAVELDTHHGEIASSLPRIYRKRCQELDWHKAHYQPTVEGFLVQADLEREYERLAAYGSPEQINGRRSSADVNLVLKVFREAYEYWPLDFRIRFAESRYHRYIWDNVSASEILRNIIRGARNGHDRRTAQINLAETLLRHARFDCADDSVEREAALAEADQSLAEPLRHEFNPKRVIVLRDQVSLELGREVDWKAIDATFETVLGSDYALSVAQHISSLRDGESPPGTVEPGTENALDLSWLVRENFTDVELLRSLGELYFRRAELSGMTTDDTALSLKRAYVCFDACRMLEEADPGEEMLTTKFLRARTIFAAAKIGRTMDPFPWIPQSKVNWLTLGIDLYQSCVSRSSGRFKDVCKTEVSECHRFFNMLLRAGDPHREPM